MRIAYLSLLFLCLVRYNLVQAQLHLTKGTVLPENAKKGDWFWNSTDETIWHYSHDNWYIFRIGKCTKAEACHQFLFIEKEEGRAELLTVDGAQAGMSSPIKDGVHCFEGLFTIESLSDIRFCDSTGRILSQVSPSQCGRPSLDTVRGAKGFCVPEYVPLQYSGSLSCKELKNWGILGVDGKWLIAPIFDNRFEFDNGVAEVLSYGQKRKINEKGEFVE